MEDRDIQAPGIRHGNLLLFEPAQAIRALDELEEANALILGADRLILSNEGIQPIGVIDVSPGGTDTATYARVRAFLDRDNDRAGTVYELVWN